MHILIIPSEGFVPEGNKLEGIFPYHQAVILKEAGYKVGALSIQLSLSVPMIIKGILYKLIGKKTGNSTDKCKVGSLLKIGLTKFFAPQKFISIEVLDGIIVYRIDALYRRPSVHNKNHFSWIKAGLICFDEYIKKNGPPDVVHAHETIYAGMLAEKIKNIHGINYIITEHSTSYSKGTLDAGNLKRVQSAHKSSIALFAVSNSFAEFLNALFSFRRFRYLPNVLDPYLESASYEKAIDRNNKFRFLNVALLKPMKDHRTLINAFEKVVEKNSNVELLIGGFGELRDELLSLVVQNGLQANVRFLGLLNRDEVIEELKHCDCFVLSSKYETFGVVIIEAMLFGKPVIATNVGVAPNIVTDKVGNVVETGNEQQLADAMLKMISTHTKYDAETIRDFTIKNFGKDQFLRNMNKIYKEVV